jgi:hypothetical protein
LPVREAFRAGGGGGGGKPRGFAAAFATGSRDVASGPVAPGAVSRERERRIRALVELKPVLPAPHPGALPNFGIVPGGGWRGRAFFFHGASCALSSKVWRNPLGGAGVVCAHKDAPHNPASAAPIGTAKRNAE